MRDLLRSAEGEINRGEFRKGAGFLLALTGAVLVLLFGVRRISISMEWMTVAVAPFFGLVVFFAVCSLIYFWYCVFIKRLRGMGQGLLLLHSWLAAMFLASVFRLIAYQDHSLNLGLAGPLAYADFISIALSLLAVFLFLVLLMRGWIVEDTH